MRARQYPRVSTDEQAKSGYSLQEQIAQMDLYCKLQNWTVTGRYVEDASAKDMNRPKLKQMLREAAPGDVILVYKLDRLTRSVRDLDIMLQMFAERGLEFASVNEKFDTTTAGGRLTMRMIAEVAQWERETIAERTTAGKRRKVEGGEWQGGPIPFGYKGVPSGKMKAGKELLKLVPDERNAHIVPMIFERYLAGHGVRGVCIWLNEDMGARTTRGARFRAASLIRILKNPIYAGDVFWGKRKQKDVIQRPGSHEPLIGRATFDKVQEMFEQRKTFAPRQATGQYPLAGVARCGVCGGPIDSLLQRKKENYFYRCHNYVNGTGCGKNGEKPLSGFVGHAAEEKFLQLLEGIGQPEEMSEFVTEWEAGQKTTARSVQAEADRIRHDIAEAEFAVKQWDAKFEKGRMTEDEHEEKTAPHRERLAALRGQLREAAAALETQPNWEALRFVAIDVRTVWENLTPPERKAWLQSFVQAFPVRILLYPDRTVRLAPLQ